MKEPKAFSRPRKPSHHYYGYMKEEIVVGGFSVVVVTRSKLMEVRFANRDRLRRRQRRRHAARERGRARTVRPTLKMTRTIRELVVFKIPIITSLKVIK